MLTELKASIDKTVKHLSIEYGKLQLWRANPSMIEDVHVDIYGSIQPIKNAASINVMDNQTLSIQPWDKSVMHSIAKGITESGLGLNPQVLGDSIIIRVPMMTEERRREISKYAKTLMEDAKVWVRNARQDVIKSIKKQETDKEISEDERKDYETDVQKFVDEANKKIEELYKIKDAEIMKV